MQVLIFIYTHISNQTVNCIQNNWINLLCRISFVNYRQHYFESKFIIMMTKINTGNI